MKETTLKELNDREETDFSGFIENLKTHEMEMKVWEEREPLEKKNITVRTSPSILEDEEDEFSMLDEKSEKYSTRREKWATSVDQEYKEMVTKKKRIYIHAIIVKSQNILSPVARLPK